MSNKKILFISDLHLNEHNPHLTKLFIKFIQTEAIHCKALYILGDLFDFWVGDDEDSPLISIVYRELSFLRKNNVNVYFQHGNRDFLIGKSFANSSQCQLLNEYHTITIGKQKILLCHGDTLCTNDKKYQRFRKIVHNKYLQKLFILLPLPWRLHIANSIRNKSKNDKYHKSSMIMDVNHEFTQRKYTEFNVNAIIHGHTHKQAIHKNTHQEKNKDMIRIVLGDWQDSARYLSFSLNGNYQFEEMKL